MVVVAVLEEEEVVVVVVVAAAEVVDDVAGNAPEVVERFIMGGFGMKGEEVVVVALTFRYLIRSCCSLSLPRQRDVATRPRGLPRQRS